MILRHAFPRTSAVVVLVLSVVLNATFTVGDNPPGCADYIRAGIGYEGPVQVIKTEYEYYTITEEVVPSESTPTFTPTLDFAAASACSSSWSDYSRRATKNVIFKHVTTTIYTTLSTKLTYGTGDVYTTEPVYGIPVANGNFTATSTGTRLFNITSTLVTDVPVTLDPSLGKATPACTLIKPEECSELYVSYLSSLGLPANATVPDIRPVPTNSPPCPSYYYKPFTSCGRSFVTSYPNDCTIMGNSVQLFYFPQQTDSANTDSDPSPATITAPPAVVYEYAPGTTFTSPSIYLKFDYLSAQRLNIANDAMFCTTCDNAGCRVSAVDGGQSINNEGTSIKGQLVSLAPEEVSSIVLNFNDQEASSIIRTMAHGLPGYAAVMEKVVRNFDVVAKRLNLDDVRHPPPEAYYLQPLDNAPGCDLTVPQPECSTIFEGAYRALISLPQEVTGFQGAWKSCFPVIYGVYDPPIALTKASTVDGATLPGYRPAASSTPAASAPPEAVPADLPQIPPIARPTALPDALPAQGGNNGLPAGPTLPSSGGSSANEGTNSGASDDSGGSPSGNGGGMNGNGAGGGTNGGGGVSNGGGSNNNGGGSNNNGVESTNNGGGSNNNGGGSNNNGAGYNNGGGSDNGGGSNDNGGSGGSGASGSNGAPNDSNGANSGNTEGGGGGDRSPGTGNSSPSGTRTPNGNPSRTHTPTEESGGSTTSESTSSASLASAARPRALMSSTAMCLSLVLLMNRLLLP